MKSSDNPKHWIIDEFAAEVVRKIFALCIAERGPFQISKQLENEQILIPTAYQISKEFRATHTNHENPYHWDRSTIVGILENRQYTGCTVNFKTTTVSYKVHKTIQRPDEEQVIIPNTQEAIIDEDTFNRVQELREHRRRPTATGRVSIFSGLLFCPDCGSKLHFCAAKSLKPNQEFYRCANYKSGRGSCTIHFIRNVVLEKIVLEAIRNLAEFVSSYEPVFMYLLMRKNYEMARAEQKELISTVSECEKKLSDATQKKTDLHILLDTLRKCTDITELTPTVVNRLIKRIEVHNNDKYDGHCHVKVDIYFTAAGYINIPDEQEILKIIEEIKANPNKYKNA